MANADTIHNLQACVHAASYRVDFRLNLAQAYEQCQFPDLAAGEAYLMLLLIDEALDESSDCHEHAITATKRAILAINGDDNLIEGFTSMSTSRCDYATITEDAISRKLDAWSLNAFIILSESLIECGSLQSALDFCKRGLRKFPEDCSLQSVERRIYNEAKHYYSRRGTKWDSSNAFDVKNCPELGLVRREIYAWNGYEPDRFSDESLDFLNRRLADIAPKLTIRTVYMPILPASKEGKKDRCASSTTDFRSKQLGLFAKEYLKPEEIILNEASLLTANARLYDSFCDACGASIHIIPATEHLNGRTPVSCSDCEDVFFCDNKCLESASEKYHPAMCGKDIEAIAKDSSASEASNSLYSLLLLRSFALAATQDVHPLDLPEVKFLWGDYTNNQVDGSNTHFQPRCTLPFSFQMNILLPLHMLQKMEINIFESSDRYNTWVFNTLYAKFRGTASARQGLDGKPEVGAVHPMWCLANHSCDPNVSWEWGGLIRFAVRKQRIKWTGQDHVKEPGIQKGEEVLNHYCDIDLPVRERREWAVGALGGFCTCERCLWEVSCDE